ncbi:MAG: DbpA RNA binding domain-containing protein [Spirochaetota bacterium]|nr:DbpA RNA binding domain-containing protein [Spirochaetota bacterium]
MSQETKVEKIIKSAQSEDLSDYNNLLKAMKKKLPFFIGTKRIALALLKEYIGDISRLDTTLLKRTTNKTNTGKILFEDVKDGKAKLFINIGKNHNISPGDLIKEIVTRSGVDGKSIGKIDIHSTYTFFEIPEQYAEMVLLSLDKKRIKGMPIAVEPAKKRKNQ